MPRSWRALWAHPSPRARVRSTRASARAGSPPVTSRATACIVSVLARWAGVGDPVEVPGVEGDQPPRGVEHVDDRRLPRVDVAHRGGEHRGDALLVGEPEQPPGVAARGRGALGSAVADHLDDERHRAAAGAARRRSSSRARSVRRASSARPTSESGPSSTTSGLGSPARCCQPRCLARHCASPRRRTRRRAPRRASPAPPLPAAGGSG